MSLFSKQHSSLALLLDVQSSIVRGILVNFQKPNKPEFIFSYAAEIPFKSGTNSGYLVKMTIKAVTETIEASLRELSLRKSSGIRDSFPNKINQVHYILSSPWIVSQARTIAVSLKKKEKITKEKIRAIIAEERQKLTNNETDNISVIEEKVFDVYMNGYSVPNWEGLSTDKLEVSFVVSVAGSTMIKNLKDITHRIVSENKVHFHSSLLLQNIGIQKIVPNRSDYSLIHVHGELTDVVVIKNHACVFFGSFPIGIRNIIREIANRNKTDEHAAESLLTLYLNNHLDPSHAMENQKVIEEVSANWTTELENLFKKFDIESLLPKDTIISAHSHDEYFINIFKKYRTNSIIDMLEFEDIKPYVNFSKQNKSLRTLGLCTVAINNNYNE